MSEPSLTSARFSSRVEQARAILAQVPRGLRLVYSACPRLTATWGGLLLIQGVLPVVGVYLTRLVIDALVRATREGFQPRGMEEILLLAGGMAAVLILSELLQVAVEAVRVAQAEKVHDRISALIHHKAAVLDMEYHDSPQHQDYLHRARTEANTRPLALLENIGTLLQGSITLLGLGALLFRFGLWLPLVLALGSLPSLYVMMVWNRRYHAWSELTTERRRRTQYYDALLTLPQTAPEVRLFNLTATFREAFQVLRDGLYRERVGQMRAQALGRLAAVLFTMLVSGAVMVWMLVRAVMAQITVGDLTLFYQAANTGQAVLRTAVGGLAQVYNNSLFLGDLFRFLELEPKIKDPEHPVPLPSPARGAIEFRDVTFHYPGSDRVALRDFSLRIEPGEITAIVGPNGAGKSTLLKLLCRFYDPDEGAITVGGVNLRNVSLENLRREIAVLFQSPIQYEASVRENILWGDVTGEGGEEEAEIAGRAAGAHDFVSRLPEGYSSLLGRYYVKGTQLSGGEWQRLALARAFLRKAPLIILDEPTSAMDPWAEAEWFDRFKELARGRTAILITHRFNIAMRADSVHVMHEGRIVESGTHQELVALGGEYNRSWCEQLDAAYASLPAVEGARPL